LENRLILIVEDEKDIADILTMYLEDIPNIEIQQAASGEIALEIIKKKKISLMLLDIMLPKMSGYEVLRKIKKRTNIPVIIISAKIEDNEVILGLNLGADDYITKPFNSLIVVARVKAQLRRLQNSYDNSEKIIRVDDLLLNTTSCSLQKDGEEIELTYLEYKMLKYFMEHQNHVLSNQQLLSSVWGEDANLSYYNNNIIMVYISKLRFKIEDNSRNPQYIKTVRGLGYKFGKKK